MTLTEYLQSLKDVGDKATKGPWKFSCDFPTEGDYGFTCDGIFHPVRFMGITFHELGDVDFIATARNEWDRLIKMNEVLLKGLLKYTDSDQWAGHGLSESQAIDALKECEGLMSGRN